MYQVKLEKFEGPLELLLDLIEKEKMKIAELSLAKVADQYLEFIHNEKAIKLENLADFLTVASKLILIKSRSLLPVLKFSEEAEEEIKDLAQQLEIFKKFKEASEKLKKISEQKRICYTREEVSQIEPIFYPPENINAHDLKKYFLTVVSEIPQIDKLQEEMVREVMTLEEKINDLGEMLRRKVEASFSEIVSKKNDKLDIIISFLAMLEMVKQKLIEVEQKDLFQDIKLKAKS
jgi:segregation and condensation protein A